MRKLSRALVVAGATGLFLTGSAQAKWIKIYNIEINIPSYLVGLIGEAPAELASVPAAADVVATAKAVAGDAVQAEFALLDEPMADEQAAAAATDDCADDVALAEDLAGGDDAMAADDVGMECDLHDAAVAAAEPAGPVEPVRFVRDLRSHLNDIYDGAVERGQAWADLLAERIVSTFGDAPAGEPEMAEIPVPAESDAGPVIDFDAPENFWDENPDDAASPVQADDAEAIDAEAAFVEPASTDELSFEEVEALDWVDIY